MPGEALRAVRARVDSGEFALGADLQRAILSRIDDLMETIAVADRALAKLPNPGVAEAAAKLTYLFYMTGHGWRRYLAESSAATAAGAAIRESRDQDAADALRLLAQLLAARPAAPVTRRDDGSWALPCAACFGDAVSCSVSRVSTTAPEQLVISSLSPVTVFRPVAGSRMKDLLDLLEAGDASAVVSLMRETLPAGCDAYCETCNRVYCKNHFAVEAR